MSVRGSSYRFVDQGDRPVLHLSRRVSLGVDVGDLLELERPLQSDRVGDPASQEEEPPPRTATPAESYPPPFAGGRRKPPTFGNRREAGNHGAALLTLISGSPRRKETAMNVGFYGHVRQYNDLKAELDAAIHGVLESGEYVLGPALARFERELASFHEMKHAVGVNSGTDALWLTFLALGIGPGDEVITTANTFFATDEAICFTVSNVVFVDIDPD